MNKYIVHLLNAAVWSLFLSVRNLFESYTILYGDTSINEAIFGARDHYWYVSYFFMFRG